MDFKWNDNIPHWATKVIEVFGTKFRYQTKFEYPCKYAQDLEKNGWYGLGLRPAMDLLQSGNPQDNI